jgi:hypothetical protein
MAKQNLLTLFAFIILVSTSVKIFPQQVEVKDAGSFSGSLNGKEFNNPIRFGESDEIVSIATGDETFTLTLNFNDIASISQIKTGTVKLPAKDNSVTVMYVDNNMGMPSIITDGTLTIMENNDKVLRGKLEFIASAGGVPKEMGGTEIKLSNGSFEIPKTK